MEKTEKGRLDFVLESLNVGLCMLDSDLNITWGNETFRKWFGGEHRIYGKHPCRLYQLKDHDKKCIAKRVLRTGEAEEGVIFNISKRGKLQYFNLTVIPLKGKNKDAEVMLEVVYDITAHVLEEERLGNAGELSRGIVERMGDGLIVVDKSYKITYMNDILLDLLGLRRSDAVGKRCYEVLRRRRTACDDPAGRCPHHVSLETGERAVCEHRCFTKDDKEMWTEFSSSPMDYEGGEAASAVDVVRDITERKKDEERIRDVLELYSRILDAGSVAFTLNEDCKINFSNKKFSEFSGHTSDEAFLQNFKNMLDGESASKFNDFLSVGDTDTVVAPIQLKIKAKDGKKKWLEAALRIRKNRGRFAGADVVGIDISSKKNREEHERFLKQVMDNSMDAIFYYTPDGMLRLVSKKAERLFGLKAEGIIGQSIFKNPSIPKEHHDEIKETITRAKGGETIINSDTYRLDGGLDKVFVSSIFAPFTTDEGEVIGFLEICREIAHIKKFKRQLGRRTREIEAITSLSGELTKEAASERFMKMMLVQCTAITGSYYAAIIYMKKEGGQSLFMAGNSISGEDQSANHPFFILARRLIGKAAASKTPAVINDVRSHFGESDAPKTRPLLSSMISFPLTSGGRTVGLLAIGNKSEDGGTYDEGDLKVVEMFANAAILAAQRDRILLDNINKQEALQRMTHAKGALINTLSSIMFVAPDITKDQFLDDMFAGIEKMFHERYRPPQSGLDVAVFAQMVCDALNELGASFYLSSASKNVCVVSCKYGPWGDKTSNTELLHRLARYVFTRLSAQISSKMYVSSSKSLGFEGTLEIGLD